MRIPKDEVKSFENRVKTDRRISKADRDSFLEESAGIKAKIDRLIGKL